MKIGGGCWEAIFTVSVGVVEVLECWRDCSVVLELEREYEKGVVAFYYR